MILKASFFVQRFRRALALSATRHAARVSAASAVTGSPGSPRADGENEDETPREDEVPKESCSSRLLIWFWTLVGVLGFGGCVRSLVEKCYGRQESHEEHEAEELLPKDQGDVQGDNPDAPAVQGDAPEDTAVVLQQTSSPAQGEYRPVPLLDEEALEMLELGNEAELEEYARMNLASCSKFVDGMEVFEGRISTLVDIVSDIAIVSIYFKDGFFYWGLA